VFCHEFIVLSLPLGCKYQLGHWRYQCNPPDRLGGIGAKKCCNRRHPGPDRRSIRLWWVWFYHYLC